MLPSRLCRGAIVTNLIAAGVLAQSSQPAFRAPSAGEEDAIRPGSVHVIYDADARRFAKENDAIWTELHRPLREFGFEDLPLDQAISALTLGSSIRNVHVRWQVLVDAGLARDKPITARLRETTIKRALELVLDEAGGADIRLSCEPMDGVLIISTEEDLYRRMDVRVY